MKTVVTEMEAASQLRPWDELLPDALGLIFNNLSLQDTLTVIPRVCKSWGKAVAGPYCWQEIDIDEWSTYCKHELIGPMVEMLIARSRGSLRKFSVASIPTDDIFSFIANNAGSLQDLKVPRSHISNSIVEKVAPKLKNITVLDISYCTEIGAPALEAIGKHCKSLVVLQRVMHPLTVEEKICQNDEAHAIATTMPKLTHLELAYALVNTEAVLEILLNCPQLQYLDVRGCWDVKLDEDLIQEKFSRLKVMGPIVEDSIARSYWENCSDISESSGYLDWDIFAAQLDVDLVDYDDDSFDDDSFGEVWDDEQRLEELELRFYEGFNGDIEYGWPS